METKKDSSQKMTTLSPEQNKKLWRALMNLKARAQEYKERQLEQEVEDFLNSQINLENDLSEEIGNKEMIKMEMLRTLKEHNLRLDWGDNKKNRFNSQELLDVATVAGYHIEKGVRKFDDFVNVMVNDLGEWVKPYLKGTYKNIRSYPGMEENAKDMNTDAEVDAYSFDAGPE